MNYFCRRVLESVKQIVARIVAKKSDLETEFSLQLEKQKKVSREAVNFI